MSFVWKSDDGPLLSEEEIARRVHGVACSRGMEDVAAVMALMCIRQESGYWCPFNRKDPTSENYPHDSESDDGRSVAYYQQQNGRPGDTLPEGDRDNWWGPMSCRMNLECSTDTFLSRLDDDYNTATDGVSAGRFIQNVQGSAFPDAYARHWEYCWSLLNRALADTSTPLEPVAPPSVKPVNLEPHPFWTGDPLYLPMLLEMFGVSVSTFTDAEGVPWDQRGHGDFDVIDYVVWHHTGSVNETDEGIAHHPTLGLAANMLVHPDGHTVLTGSGIAYHAGFGIWPGVPEDEMNQRSIGIECAYSWGPDEPNNPWPPEQAQAMINIGGAISWFLGDTLPPDHQIAHKEWAGADNPIKNKQGKPDPANWNMNWFRGEIAKRAALGPTETGGQPMPDMRRRSQSIYRTDDESIGDMEAVVRATNGMTHEATVERLALLGDEWSLALVKAVAEGKSPVELPDWAAGRAKLILDKAQGDKHG